MVKVDRRWSPVARRPSRAAGSPSLVARWTEELSRNYSKNKLRLVIHSLVSLKP